MAQKKSETFGVSFSNVPLLNLRWEFREFYQCAHTEGFLNQSRPERRPLETRYFIWLGMRDGCASMMVMRSIIGLEAYLLYAAQTEAVTRGVQTPELKQALRNPFTLGRSAVSNYFNKLPALIDASIAMNISAPKLWTIVAAFYREIRNPLMHGQQLSNLRGERFGYLFDVLADIYDWIDGWHDPNHVAPGAAGSFRVR